MNYLHYNLLVLVVVLAVLLYDPNARFFQPLLNFKGPQINYITTFFCFHLSTSVT